MWCTCLSLCCKVLKLYGLNHDITKLKVHHFTTYVGSRFLIPVYNLYVVTNGCAVLFWNCKRYLSDTGHTRISCCRLLIMSDVSNCRRMALPWQQADSANLELNQISNRTVWHTAPALSRNTARSLWIFWELKIFQTTFKCFLGRVREIAKIILSFIVSVLNVRKE